MKNVFFAIICIILLLVKNSFGDFGCECGAFKNNQEEAAKCFEAQKILDTDINLAFNPQSRIVGGYDVKESCMKRPSLVLIRVLGLVDKGLIGYCMGSIINKNYVISAAHCYCASKYGECTENDGAMISGRTESGLPKYGKANLVSFADPRTATNTMVFVPGFAPSYSKSQVLELQYQATGPGVSPVDEIVIHPQFILNKRVQNDIALVKVRKPFDFSSPLKVSPICLPPPGFQDHDISAYVTGYGELFERNSCNTGLGGPEEYRPCRKYFAMNNDLFEVENACLNFASPADRDPECKEFRNQHPAYSKAKALISVDGTIRTCHPPSFDGVASWCAVCVEGTKMGEPGFCPEDDQFLEIENRNDVSAHVGWGYCDKMCFQFTKANDLQEAEITALSEQECQKRSEKYLLHAETLANRPEKALELCGAKEKKFTLTTFIKVGETFIANETVSQEIWGGSDTCQGDSGGPLWTVKDGKAYLVGVTNRGTGCARKDTYGIYARVAAHRDWILLMADSGKCDA